MPETSQFALTMALRVSQRLRTHGGAAAAQYGAQILRTYPEHADAILAHCGGEVRVLIEALAAEADERRVTLAREIDSLAQAQTALITARREARMAPLRERLAAARRTGTATAYLCTLATMERNELATPAERDKVIAEQAQAIRSTQVRDLLGCSVTELNRWAADGRLPVQYVRKVMTPGGASTPARYWRVQDVQQAITLVPQWRQEDCQARGTRKIGTRS